MKRINGCFLLLGLCVALATVLPRHSQASAPLQTNNLVANGGFENGFNGWQTCGTARLADAQGGAATMVHNGRYAARFGTTAGNNCPKPPSGYDYMCCNQQAVWQQIAIPADAPALTVSFWYWVEGTPQEDLDVLLGANQYDFTNSFNGVYLGRVSPYYLPGWQLYRHVLKPADLDKVRGKTLLLSFQLEDPVDDKFNFAIDDVQVVPAAVRTTPALLPAALKGDGTLPLAYVRTDADNSYNRRLYRMDTDGTKAELIYRGELSDVGEPVWSWGGTQIAIIDGNVYPPDERDPNKYVTATALTVMNCDGSNLRQIHQTGGIPGDPDFIQEFTDLSWAPDDSGLAASIFAYQRYDSGKLDGGLARIELINATTGKNTKLLDYATSPEWGRNNRILFEAYDLLGKDRDEGVWELNVATQPLVEQQLTRRGGYDEDNEPVWAPDGQHFVTVRPTGSSRYEEDGDSVRNEALMLFDRNDLAKPRMLLLGDLGYLSHPAWSPDGKYVVYTLGQGNRSDIWWLEVATGATGPITTDGLSRDAHWRPNPPTLGLQAAPCGVSPASPVKVYLPFVQR